ncbi:hypothetical protein MUG91_G50n28 [Manis pentadactyla]|nr:hypothetical protein MUG91_G50n28 [Manis pentadactyla]
MEVGGPMLWGREGRPGSPADDKGEALHFAFHLADESVAAAITQQQLSVQGTPAPRGLTSAVERQALGQLDISSAKKMQSVFWEKVGSRPSYPGAEVGTAVGAASTGGLYQATPTETVAQEKKSPEDVSKGTLGKTFPSWGQRVPAAPLEAATFPPVSGVPLPGKSKRYSLVRLFAKHSKHRGAGKNSVARRTREFELLVGRDNNPDGDPVPKGQVTRNHLTSPQDQKGSSNLLEHRDVVRHMDRAQVTDPHVQNGTAMDLRGAE